MKQKKGGVGVRGVSIPRSNISIDDVCEFFESDYCNFRVQITEDAVYFHEYCKGFYKPCSRYKFAEQRKRDKLAEDDKYNSNI